MSIFRGICTRKLGTSNNVLQKLLHNHAPTGTFLKHIPALFPAWAVTELTYATDVNPNTMWDFVDCVGLSKGDFNFQLRHSSSMK